MASLIEELDVLALQPWNKDWQNPALRQFLLSGDIKLLANLPKFKLSWVPNEFIAALPPPDKMDALGTRFLQICLTVNLPDAIGSWLAKSMPREADQQELFAKGCAVAREAGCSNLLLATQVVMHVRPLRSTADQSPTPAGQFLLSLDDKTFGELVGAIGWHVYYIGELVGLYAAHGQERWKNFLEKIRHPADVANLHVSVWVLPLQANTAKFLEPAARAFELAKGHKTRLDRFELGAALHQVNPQQFHAPMEQLCLERLPGVGAATDMTWQQVQQAGCWLVVHSGRAALPHLQKYFASKPNAVGGHKNPVLDQAAQTFGRDAVPLFEACFAVAQPDVQLHALKLWIPLKTDAHMASMTAKFKQLLAVESIAELASAARLAGDWNPAAVEAALWPLFGHKSRPVRDAAVGALAKLGDSRLSKAKELWAVRRTDARISTAHWLQLIGTPAAIAELKSRLEDEEADDVRDAILLALDKISGGSTNTSAAEIKERIEKTVAKLKGSPVAWLDPKLLPQARLKNGSPLPHDWLLYLLYRQSRVKEIRADIEARPLLAQLDRHSTSDLALAVLQGFFGSKADADDRWAMAFAALLGNDRLVPVFTRQIKEWADNMRGKLAEYAVQALALMGTDAALLAVDAMAIRYRSKNKNIGKAATEAFAAAAEARGLTVEELGDLVVPWLGFKPGEPRIVDTGKAKIEARISSDFKVILRDTATNKKVAKLPDGVSAETKEEFKELSAGLKEAVKSQLLRMETLMVRQFRWPVARWQELYLQHPLLLPFAQRLVWGSYDGAGKLIVTARALEDQSLTNAADEPLTLAAETQVGIVHPLELDAEVRQAWLKHLADYDIVPPFAQLERPVVAVKAEENDLKFGRDVADTKLNGLTFKGRAERLGWARGSVCDGGMINFYLKTFPAAGADVFLEIEGMYVGIDMYSDITLGKMFFVKHGSVQIGGYTYDEPRDDQDARLVRFRDVPPIAFSEAMGDLTRIAGKDKTQTEEKNE